MIKSEKNEQLGAENLALPSQRRSVNLVDGLKKKKSRRRKSNVKEIDGLKKKFKSKGKNKKKK